MDIPLIEIAMWKTLFGILIAGCVCASVGAQQSINTPSQTEVLPPAPNAAALTRYAGLPLNFATGGAYASIAMTPVKQGDLQVDLQLSYQGGNGIKINEIASRAGMSWLLQAGGVVTRTVFGLSDEDHHWLTPPANLQDDSPATYNYLDSATRGGYDTQTDLFSFNFGSYSGTFFLKPTDKSVAILSAAAPLKIELNLEQLLGSSWSIRITDPQGIQYEFGGLGATEKSRTVPSGDCGRTFDAFVPNAWYLKTIRGIHGEVIRLDYVACNYDYYADVSQTRIRTPPATLINPACPPNTCAERSEQQICYSDLRHQGVILKSITSKYQRVSFSYSSRLDLVGDSLLSEVQYYRRDVVDTNLYTATQSYALYYIYSSNNSYYNPNSNTFLQVRPFLQQVTRQSSGLTPQKYQMHYIDIDGLASRLSFAQDYWGFFNGKNNQHLIPTSPVAQVQALFGTLADREPNGSYGVKGMLSRIIYPSGGSDSLEYEANTIYEGRSIPAPATVSRSVQGLSTKDPVSTSFSFSIGQTQNVTVDMAVVYSGSGVNDSIHQNGIFEILDASNAVVYTYLMPIDSAYTQLVLLTPGNYTFRCTAHGQAAIAEINLTYQNYPPPVFQNYDAGGVRVVRNLSIPNTGEIQSRRFVYHALDNSTQSSGQWRQPPDAARYYAELLDGTTCVDGHVVTCSYVVGYSTGVFPLFYAGGAHLFYSDVIVWQDEQLQAGATAYHYLGSEGFNPTLVRGRDFQGVAASNGIYPVGTLEHQYALSIQGSFPEAFTYKIIRHTQTHYRIDSRGTSDVANYVVRQAWPNTVFTNPPSAAMFEPFEVMRYIRSGYWMYADTITTTTYDPQGLQAITQQQVNVYNSFAHQQPNQVSYTSSQGPVKRMVMRYPEEMALLAPPLPYLGLLAQHRVAIPIRTSQYADTTFVQEQSTYYDSWPGNQYQPVEMALRIAAQPEQAMVHFQAYDNWGQLLSQMHTSGSASSYQYGYGNSLVIAECKNAPVNSFYVENFEDDALAATGNAHTGTRYKNGTFYVSWVIPNGRQYRLRYFYLSAGAWHFKQVAYSGPQTLSDGTAIDDVAIFPDDAALSTFTYVPDLGISSRIDPNGNVTYYDYDAFGRLIAERDYQKDITRGYAYNDAFGSAGAITVYYNQTQSQAFTKTCSIGSGTSVTYTVAAGTFSSLLSQADANQQALAKIALQGQQYADEKGTCIIPLRRNQP